MGKQIELVVTGTHGPIKHGPTKNEKGEDMPAQIAEAGETFSTDEDSAAQLIELGAAKKAGGRGAASTASAKTGALPEDFPARDKLADAGIDTYAKVRAVEDLTEIPGIGRATAEKITEALED